MLWLRTKGTKMINKIFRTKLVFMMVAFLALPFFGFGQDSSWLKAGEKWYINDDPYAEYVKAIKSNSDVTAQSIISKEQFMSIYNFAVGKILKPIVGEILGFDDCKKIDCEIGKQVRELAIELVIERLNQVE